jgi:hypothetical protein
MSERSADPGARILYIIDRLALTIWTGGTWIIGYLVAPALFAVLPTASLAGQIAGHLFNRMAFVSMGCLLLLICTRSLPPHTLGKDRILLVLALVLVLLGQFVIRPWMAQTRMPGYTGLSFMQWHVIAQICYLFVSLIGLILVIRRP